MKHLEPFWRYGVIVGFILLMQAFTLTVAKAADTLVEEGVDITDMAEPTSAFQQWELVTGLVLPLIIAFIIQHRYTPKTQSLIMVGASIVAVLGQMWFAGELDNFTDPASSIMAVVIATFGFYRGVWKPLGVAPAIEAKINPGPPA